MLLCLHTPHILVSFESMGGACQCNLLCFAKLQDKYIFAMKYYCHMAQTKKHIGNSLWNIIRLDTNINIYYISANKKPNEIEKAKLRIFLPFMNDIGITFSFHKKFKCISLLKVLYNSVSVTWHPAFHLKNCARQHFVESIKCWKEFIDCGATVACHINKSY